LGIGASKGGKAKKKRKMGDSDSEDDSASDFGPAKKKAKPKKEGLLSYLREADAPAKEPSPAVSAKSTFGSTAPQKQTQTSLLTMVKSIGGTSNGVPLFKTSTRPGSSSGMPKVAKKASPSVIDIDEGDTTNYEALMPVA
nr:hypothetical protein [Tanacetum cinerariifolium]